MPHYLIEIRLYSHDDESAMDGVQPERMRQANPCRQDHTSGWRGHGRGGRNSRTPGLLLHPPLPSLIGTVLGEAPPRQLVPTCMWISFDRSIPSYLRVTSWWPELSWSNGAALLWSFNAERSSAARGVWGGGSRWREKRRIWDYTSTSTYGWDSYISWYLPWRTSDNGAWRREQRTSGSWPTRTKVRSIRSPRMCCNNVLRLYLNNGDITTFGCHH